MSVLDLTIEDTTHRAELELGPPIVKGEVRWVSSTLITSGDHNSEGGCLRRLHFERVGGKERITTAAMTAGVGMHKEIETYLTTGQLMLGPIAMAGRWAIPEPGPGLIVEQPIILGGNGAITGVWLRAAGIPVAGHVDLYNHRGEYIDPEGELRKDPPNTLETKDWKSTRDLKWAKSAAEVAATIQMNLYAMAGFKLWPNYERSRLTHVYFQREGRPQAVLATKLVERRQIEQKWEYAEGVVRRIVDAARETDSNKVEANTKACRSYNRDCPHLAYCDAGKAAREFNSLDDVIGSRMAERVLSRMKGLPVDDVTYSALEVPLDVFASLEENTMGLFEVIKPTTGATAAVTPITPPDGVGVSISIDDLVAEEEAARAQLDPPPPQPIPATSEFAMALGVINAGPLGFPKLIGRAAIMFGTLNKHELKAGMEIAARGKLEKLSPIEDPAGVVSLAGEIAKKYPVEAARAPAPAPKKVEHIEPAVAILPPDAPASNPALAANPVEGLDNAKARELAALTTTEIPGLAESVAAAGIMTSSDPATDLFAEAPAPTPAASTPAPVAPEVITVAAPVPVNPEPTKVEDVKVETSAETPAKTTTRRGRPPGSTSKKKTQGAPAEGPAPTSSPADLSGIASASAEDTSLSIYLDLDTCEGLELESLEPYVRDLCKTLCVEFKAADVRCAPEGSALGYLKWRGAVTALAVKHPPAPGMYSGDTRQNELLELVAVALRQTCVESGGQFVRGRKI